MMSKEMFNSVFRKSGIKKKIKSRNMSTRQHKRKDLAIRKAMIFKEQFQYKVNKAKWKYISKKERKNIWDKINENAIK
ncbi:hypothetical protein T552_02684 [Pneumocystis carinii B80]|uniref:Uncharacterized protein n=1 Tax=Pneumocystis carinii (strain B80) TaxID=1408658 RepID=A0A0W4ZE83_PNEC8|nr:hypothetical protein T552_02684 [Pneumocystis carinii B80]KTW26675.1 hypothetical protein T552_02684 [Pneumocystis carinii B80]